MVGHAPMSVMRMKSIQKVMIDILNLLAGRGSVDFKVGFDDREFGCPLLV